ncbi:Speckle-type POZ protein B [Araneus ventricosus]|uniref:Speckle-type POZ protein B n=1 Tax=Araneus ventricosus TaxID=182803 RepID=A0A4Y2NZD4_ARAVE|nr:Speckle-type POZ protein B [Araneus ventricosus]
MSSDSSDINNGFHFIWDIENIDISFYEESIASPTFVADNLNQTEWCMNLYPLIKEDSFMLVLSRTDSGGTIKSIIIDFILYMSFSNGKKDVLTEKKKVEFECGSSQSVYWIYHLAKILYEGDLTVYCDMQKSEEVTLPYICCSARTFIGKEQRYGVWKIPNFRQLSPGGKKKFTLCSTLKNAPQIDILGRLSKKTKSFHVEVQVTHNKPIFIFIKISLLQANGNLKWPTLEGFSFDNFTSSQIYEFPLVLKHGYLSRKSSGLLPNGTLTLLCELRVSNGTQYSEVSESSYVIESYCKLMHREISKNLFEGLPTVTGPKDTVKTQQISRNSMESNNTLQTLKQDLRNFYTQKKHCDITLQVENESFSAHRSILCSRSPVFSSMFDHDMKETVNKKVEIVDMDADTLDQFLLFLYSETLEDLQWNRATKLLYAANKYQVESLKKECSSFLMSHLSLPNVCEALVLADLHQDEQLRTRCQDYIFENASEIFSSKEWEIFTVGNPLLSAKMLQGYFSMKK